jgi:endoglucanase
MMGILVPLATLFVCVQVEASVFIQTGLVAVTAVLALLAGFAAGISGRAGVARKAGATIFVILSVLVASAAAGATGKGAKTAAAPAPVSSGETAPAARLLSPGFLSTSGNQIVDSSGTPQRLACAGYNEPSGDIPGDLAGMKRAGFNCARYPFDEAALSSEFQIMDKIVAAAMPLGMKVIFDHHVDDDVDLCGGQQENGLWFDLGEGTDNTDACGDKGHKGTITQEKFKADWVMVAKHYAGNPTVIAFDLHNEPLVIGKNATPITWGTNGPTDILKMWEEVGSAIEAADPGVLIVAECPINYTGKLLNGSPEGTKGIMDCSKAESMPAVLSPAAPKFVYSIHDYPNIGSDNEGPSIADRNAAWGYLEARNIAPVWIGEMGASLDQPHSDGVTVAQQSAWAAALVAYLSGKAPGGPTFAGAQQPFGTDWWAWGNLSGQTPDGTLQGTALRPAQLAIYSQLRFVKAAATAHLTAPASAPRRGAYLLPKGWLTTRGAQIVDGRGNPVRIASVGLPGYDGVDGALRFLRFVNYQTTMRGMVSDGFNTVRIAWSDLTLNAFPKAGAINYDLNPDLKGLSSMQVMDKVVNYAGTIGLRVIFDHHTNDGGDHGWGGQQTNGLWFDKGPGSDGTDGSNPGTITADQFKKNTLALVKRYQNNPTVIGYDLDNEPLSRGTGGVSLNWGQGGPTDIWKMYTDLGNAILALNPKLLIICEGPQGTANTGNGLAGIGPEGDLSAVGGVDGVPAKPVTLTVPHQVVYSVHEYDTNVYDYGANEQPATLIQHMNNDWGYLYTRNIAPVWIGEMGSNLDKPQDRVWAQTLLDYMNGKDGAQGGPVFKGSNQPVGGSWWLWGYFPGEQTDGTLGSDWATPRPDQQNITDQLLFISTQPKPDAAPGAGSRR